MKPEQTLHIAVARYLDLVLPADAKWSTIPAGGGGKVRGSFLKAMGLKAGLPDLMVWWRGTTYGIELKAIKGRLSAEQRGTIGGLATAGVPVAVCRSIEDVEAALRMWGFELVGRLA